MLQCIQQSCHVAGNRRRLSAVQFFIAYRLGAAGFDGREHIGCGSCGSLFPEVDKDTFAGLSVTDQHKAAAADAAGARLANTQSKGSGHRCVNGVAALLQDAPADVCRLCTAGRNNAFFAGTGTA